MLNIVIGSDRIPNGYRVVFNPNTEFSRRKKKPEWFENKVISSILLGVDGSEVLLKRL